MFRLGDKVIYGNDGVCEVVAITEKTFPGGSEKRPYYTLKPLYQEYMIHTPVNNSKVFIRPVITREEAEKLIAEIPSYDVPAPGNRLRKEAVASYQESIRSHDCRDLFEMTMGIYAKRQSAALAKRAFGAMDEQFMKRAEELLFGELAVALDIPKEDVPEYIKSRLREAQGDETETYGI